MMKHIHRGGRSRHSTHNDNPFCEMRGPSGFGGGRHGGREGGRRAGNETQGPRGRSLEVLRAMHNLKTALRLRMASGPVDETAVDAIAAAIDEAAQKIGKA